MIEDCTAVILAGGQSSRMGQDKANLVLGEQTLLQAVASTLRPLFAEVLLSVREPRAEIGLRQICDSFEHQGPLGGLLAGLEAASTSWVFLVACDMPFMSSAVIEYLAMLRPGHQAIVPLVHDHPQPMAALYEKASLLQIRRVLQDPAAKHSLRSVLAQLNVHYVAEVELLTADPQLRSFFDLDTPQDLLYAKTLPR
jgi:molybdopterin-guanine dinucleotide biosynthesis protein A